MKNILYITNYADLYVANKSLLDMIIELKKKYGVNPIVLISGAAGKLGEKLDEYAIEYLCFDFRIACINNGTKYITFRKLTRRIMRFKEYRRILNYIKKNVYDLDIIHSNSSIIELGYYLAKKIGVPHVWHLREFGESDYNLSSIFTPKELIQRLQNSCLIAISDAVKNHYETRYKGIECNKIYNDVWIPNAYQKVFFANDKVNFAVVGVVTNNKGQMDVVKACSILRKRGFEAFSVCIIGTIDRNTEEKFAQFIRCNQINEQVEIYGHTDDVHSILKDMDVGIMSSKEEAMGRVTVEYMGNYMSVIGTRGGGTSELLNNDGLLYEYGDVNQLADRMQYLIENRDEIITKSESVRKKAEKYNCGTCAKLVYQLYSNL